MKKASLAILSILASIASLPSSSVADWKPADPKLITEWGEKTTPENAWREYPRPQFVRDRWTNLNGLWDYAVRPQTDPQPNDYDGEILVPFAIESALSGVGKSFPPEDRLWYRRTFEIPSEWNDQRILLHFGAVDYESTLWINDSLVGSHKGGSDAFTFDITAFTREGKNELILSVIDPTDTGEQPRGKQQLNPEGIWYTPVSGIWQTVWLEPVPNPHYIAELRITPDVENKRVSIIPLIESALHRNDLAVKLTAFANGNPVGKTIVRINREGFLKLDELHLWSPESPFLYDLKAELVEIKPPSGEPRIPAFGKSEREAYANAEVTGDPIDTVTSYFGMRSLTIGSGFVENQPGLHLNGEPIFQHGPLDQGWWPESLLTPPSDEAMIWEIEWLKNAGFNMLRKHIKIEPARYYYHCDRLGILVWQDMPSGFNQAQRNFPGDEGEPIRLSTSMEQHELELRRMINRLYNHPSIAMWVIHNEGWGQYESPALTDWVSSIDPSRWINSTTGWLDQGVGDIYSEHSYHEQTITPRPAPDRAVILGEYGGVGWPIKDHLWNPASQNWGYQTYHSKEDYLNATLGKMESLLPMRDNIGLSAGVYTQTTDVEIEVNGLMTYDRKVIKVSPEKLREINNRLQRIESDSEE